MILLAAAVSVAVAALLLLMVSLVLLRPVYRERRKSTAPAALYRASMDRPLSVPAPITARPAEALPAPQAAEVIRRQSSIEGR